MKRYVTANKIPIRNDDNVKSARGIAQALPGSHWFHQCPRIARKVLAVSKASTFACVLRTSAADARRKIEDRYRGMANVTLQRLNRQHRIVVEIERVGLDEIEHALRRQREPRDRF